MEPRKWEGLYFGHIIPTLVLDPNGLKDQYADYQKLNYDHSMINYSYAVENPKAYKAYGKDFLGINSILFQK